MSGTYSLSTLGELGLVGPDGPLLRGRRKELVLLAYIARKSPKGASRDELATLLWGERDEDKARQSLRHALHQLRRALGDAIDTTGEQVRVTDAVSIDASMLDADIANGRLRDGVQRWAGDFLAGAEDAGGEEYAAWLERERERLRRTVVSGFSRLIEELRRSGSADEAQFARRWAEWFPLDEAAHLALVDALRRRDAIDEARALHAAFVARLRAELDVAPSVELVRAGEELSRSQQREKSRRPGAGAILAPDLVGRGAAILNSLYELWTQSRTEGCMAVVEGGAGTGKTRLRGELIRRVREAGGSALVLDTAAQPADAEPFSTLRRAMHGLVHSAAIEDAPNKALVELSGVLPDLRRRFPHLAEPAGDAERIATAFHDVLRVVGGRAPVLLVIDDHDASDAQSHGSLRRLAAAVPRGVMVLLTLSEQPHGRQRAAELSEVAGVRRFKVAALQRDEVAALIDATLEVAEPDRSRLVDRVFGETAGVPRGAVALVSDFTNDGTLVLGERGVWQLAGEARPSEPRATTIDEPEPVTVPQPAHGAVRPRRTSAATWIGGALVAAAAVALVVPLVRGSTSPRSVAADDPAPPRVAVLDLELVNGDTVDGYLASGLAEEINSTLSRFDALRIKSRGSVRTARASGVIDPIKLGESLQVDYLVEGSIRRIDSTLTVTVRLTKTSDGFQVWSKDFDARAAALPALHDLIAREVAARVGGRLTRAELATASRLPTKDPKAYEHFLRGNYYLSRRTPPTAEQAIAQYQLAAARDSAFGAAKARVSYAYALMIDWGWPYARKSPDELFHDGLRLADEAIRLDSLSTDAWMAKAYLLESADPVRMKGAAAAFERAIALDPRNTEAIHQYAQVHEATGTWDKAMEAFQRTLLLEPDRSLPYVAMASIEWKRGRPDAARRLYDSALVVDPGASYVLSARALLRLHRGDVAGGLQDAETAVHVEDGYSIPPHSVLAIALARSGSMARARLEVDRALSEIPDPSAPSPTDARFIASALIAVGRQADAVHLIERARPRGAWLWFYCLAPDFDPVRSDPTFARVIAEAHPADLPQPQRRD